MIKLVASMICLAASLYPVVADAGGETADDSSCQGRTISTPKLMEDDSRAGFEVAVSDVLRHFDAGDFAGLAAEMSASKSSRNDVDFKADGFMAVQKLLDTESARRFGAMNLHAIVKDPEADPKGHYAIMSHLRTCGGMPCEEQVVMRWVDGRWMLAGFYVYPLAQSTSGKQI